MRRWSFAKGHGTENDFVVIPDRESMLRISDADVRAICNRRAGVGGDGLLRVVKARHIEEWDGDGELWFMDYRNADGSLAQMCGNGLRVFARYLLEEGLAPDLTMPIATRNGLLEATAQRDGRIRVAVGPARVGAADATVTTADGREYSSTSVNVGNPHAVCFTDDLQQLALDTAPGWSPGTAFPDGVNVEFVREMAERHIAIRIHERGVGETRSCGTGTVAAAAAAAARRQVDVTQQPVTYRVDVPGGTVEVELHADQTYLTGPAVIVARGELTLPEEL